MSQTILVFESDPAFAKEVQYGFGRIGATVHIVTEGHNALEKAKGIAPDLIFLSAELKEANGFLLCKEFKRDTRLSAVPLVLTSSDADADTVFAQHQKLRTRAEAYIRKPSPFDSIMAQIGHLVNLQAASEESLFPIEDECLNLDLTGSDDDEFAEELRTVDIEEIAGQRRSSESEAVDISLDGDDAVDDAIQTDRPAASAAPLVDAEESTVRANAQNPTGTSGSKRNVTRDPLPLPAREARAQADSREDARRSSTREEPVVIPQDAPLPTDLESGGASASGATSAHPDAPRAFKTPGSAAEKQEQAAPVAEVPVHISSVPAAHPDVMALEERLHEVLAERDALQAAVAKERELLARERSASAEKIRALEEGLETVRSAQASEASETQQVVDLRTKLHEKTKETLAFHQAISERDRELIEQQERLLVLEKAKGSWEEQQRSLNERTEALLAEGARLSAALEAKTQSESELQNNVATLMQRVGELDAQNTELSSTVEQLTKEHDTLRDANATLERTRSEQDQVLAERATALGKANEELTSLKEALKRVDQVYRDAHAQVAELMRAGGRDTGASDANATSDGSRPSRAAQHARA